MQGRRYHPYGHRYDGLPPQHLWGSTDVWQAQGRNGLAGKFAWSLTLRFLAAWLLEGCWIVYSIIVQLNFSQGRIYSPMPHTLEELLQHAEEVIDDLNNKPWSSDQCTKWRQRLRLALLLVVESLRAEKSEQCSLVFFRVSFLCLSPFCEVIFLD